MSKKKTLKEAKRYLKALRELTAQAEIDVALALIADQ